MKILLVLLLLAASTVVGDTLDIRTTAAPVPVRPGANGIVALPALAINAAITAACTDGDPVSLTLSSADSMARVEPAALAAGETRIALTLPAAQVPLLHTRGLCTPAEGSGGSRRTLKKPAFVSLHASFRCTDGEKERLTTRTTMVDLTLECLDDGADRPNDRRDQGTSAE